MAGKYLRGTSPNILLLGVVSFLNDLSSEMIIPILPMFILALGGGGFTVGLVGGLQESISSLLKVLSGHWSDRVGRRKVFVASGYLTSACFKLLLSFSAVWQHVLVFVSLERVGKGLRTAPRDAIIADSAPAEARGRGFGIHRAFDTAGAIFGGFAVLLFYWFFGLGFKFIIFVAAVVAFFSVLPIYFVKEERRRRGTEPQEQEPQEQEQRQEQKPQEQEPQEQEPQGTRERRRSEETGLRESLKELPTPLKFFVVVATVFAFANFTYMFFILKAEATFLAVMPVKEASALVILLYVFFNIFYAVFAIPFGTLSDRIGKRKMLIFGYLLFSVVCLGFAFSDSLSPFSSLTTFLFLFPLYGVVFAMVEGTQRALVADLSDLSASAGDLRATALGTFHTLTGVAALPASLIAGFLWSVPATHLPSYCLTFLYGSTVSLVSVGLFVGLQKHFKDCH